MDLHNRRFGVVSEVFSTAARRRFHLLAAERMAEAGLARIYRLVVDGANAGLQYDFCPGRPRLLLPERHRALGRPQPWAGHAGQRHPLGHRGGLR